LPDGFMFPPVSIVPSLDMSRPSAKTTNPLPRQQTRYQDNPVTKTTNPLPRQQPRYQDNKPVTVGISPVTVLNVPFPFPAIRFVRRKGVA
jgi:hypothetical protein